MRRIVAAAAVASVMLLPTPAGADPVRGGAASYGEHVSAHASDESGFSGQMNPGNHQGFAGFDEHH